MKKAKNTNSVRNLVKQKMMIDWRMANNLVKFEQSFLKSKMLPVLVHCMRELPIQMHLENCKQVQGQLVLGLSIHSPVPVLVLVQSRRWMLEQCIRICTLVQLGRCTMVLLELQLVQSKIARAVQEPNSLDLGQRMLAEVVPLVLVHCKPGPVLVLHTEKVLRVLDCLA